MLSLLKNKSHQQVAAAAIIVFLAAIFSEGFFHPDEHFSTIELMHRKFNSELQTDIFGWDFALSIRSYFQPFVYFVVLWPFRALGLTDPFFQVLILRLLNGGLFLFSLNQFLKNYLPSNQQADRQRFFFLTLATWFVPYLIVRTSSESLSASLFLLALASANSTEERGFQTGFFAGLSFLARFQMGIPALFLFLWKFQIARVRMTQLIHYCLGILLAIFILLLVDRWGYGEWVFSPWNYLNENILKSRASEFGVDPWYYYFKVILTKGALPISLPLLLGSLYYFYWQRRSLLTWIVLPFVLVHFMIGHKEWRFLTFAYLLAPTMAYQIWLHWNEKIEFKRWHKILAGFVLLLNSGLLLKVCLTRAHAPLGIYKILYRETDPKVPLYTLNKADKTPPLDLMLRFYARHPRQLATLGSGQLEQTPKPFYLLTSTYSEKLAMQAQTSCRPQAGLYPDWILEYNFFKWRDRSAIWQLYYCP